MRLLQAHDGALEFRLQPGIGSQSLPFSWPRQAAAALQCRRQQRRQQVQALDQRGAVRSHIGIRHDSQRRHAAVEQGRHVLDRRLARLRAPRPHIARRRIDQPGIGLEAIIGAEHRLVPMPQAHPFGGQDDHARPGVQQRPGFRQRRAPELLELGAQLVDRRTARLLDAQRQDRAQRARSMFQPWRRAGSARSRTAVSTATGHTRVLGAQLAPTASRPMLACP